MLEFANLYSSAKTALAEWTGASEDLLHIHAGLLIFVLAALLLHRRMRSPWPLVLVILFAAGNEIVDFTTPRQTPLEWVADFINTVFWPTVLFLIARRGQASDRVGKGRG